MVQVSWSIGTRLFPSLPVTAINDYLRGLGPLVVPMTSLRHRLMAHRVPYLGAQLYLAPHPRS